MFRQTIAACGVLAMVAGCSGSPTQQQPEPSGAVVLFEGARLIPGDGGPPIEDSALLTDEGMITAVGARGDLVAPDGATRVDLTGKTIMPLMIDTHVHPGFQNGVSYAGENYSRATILADLNRALYFGVGAVLSQGIERGDLADQVRAEQEAGTVGGARLRIAGRGIGAPNAGPGSAAFQGIAYEVTTEEEIRESVRELAAQSVDIVKIWVDDRGGRAPRLSPALYRAAIDEAHALDLRINAHVFYHEDAVDLVDAGINGFAHLVRDLEMDDALVAAIVERGVYVMGNMSGTQRSTYAEVPSWLTDGDPLFQLVQDTVPPDVVAQMRATFADRDAAAVAGSRERFAILQRSLAKLNAAGARIILGADTGLSDHLFGLSAQRELEAMVGAGMSPAEGIVAATSRAAEYLRLDTMGSLAPGKNANLLVLDANPLDDITNTRRIAAIYVDGAEVDRAALQEGLLAGATTE